MAKHTLRLRTLVTLLLALVLSGMTNAQIGVADIQKKALLNGFEVYFLPPDDSNLTHFALMVKNGAAFDPVDKGGATNLLARMLLRAGSQARSGEAIDELLESTGARVHCKVHWDALFYFGEVPVQGTQEALTLLAERLTEPVLTEELFEEERRNTLQEIEAESDAQHRTQNLFRRELFENNPYAHAVKGTPESLKNLNLVDIKIQYRKLLLPNQSLLALSYDDADSSLFLSMGRPWGGWVRSEAAPFTFRKAEAPAKLRILLLDSTGSRSILRIGGLAVAINERDFYPLKVLEHYLTLLLPVWAREIEGSSQILGSVELTGMKMPGAFQINLEVSNDRVKDYLQRCLTTLDEVRQGHLDEARYREAKELAFLELQQRLEQPEGRLLELLKASLYGLGLSHLVNYGLRIERVRIPQISQVLNSHLTRDSLLIVAAGPVPEIQQDLDEFGDVAILK